MYNPVDPTFLLNLTDINNAVDPSKSVFVPVDSIVFLFMFLLPLFPLDPFIVCHIIVDLSINQEMIIHIMISSVI